MVHAMKKILLAVLLFTTALFAQTSKGASNIKNALEQLEQSTQATLAVTIMLCAGPLFLIAIVTGLLYLASYRKDPSKKWVIYVAIAALIISIGLVVLYYIMPSITRMLIGPGVY